MKKKEPIDLYFDLSHCPGDVEFTLQAGSGIRHTLTAYKDVPGKMEEHMKKNKALALIPEQQRYRVTHFVEDAQMDSEAVSVRRVVYPSMDGHPLPEIAMVFLYIPSSHQKRAIRYHSQGQVQRPQPMHLSYYKVPENAVNGADMEEIHLHANQIKPPYETAKSIVFHHPEIGSVNPVVVKNVFDYHVKDTQDFQNLVEYIQTHSPESKEPWYQKSWSTWLNPDTGKEEPMPANTELKFKGGKKANWPINPDTGKPSIPIYDLTDEHNSHGNGTGVLGAAQPVIFQVLRDTKDDQMFNGQLWTKQDGTTQKMQTNVPPDPSSDKELNLNAIPGAAAGPQDSAKGFAIKNTTSSYGLNLYADQLKYDFNEQRLSFPVKNWPNRYLGAYVEFFTSKGDRIERKKDIIPDWEHPMALLAAVFGDTLQPSDSESILDILSPGNQVFGIPFPTNPDTLEFKWPKNATKADVLFGGLGVAGGFKDWDTGTDIVGTVFTGLFSYGITALCLTLTVSGASTAIMQKIVKTTGTVIYAIAVGLGIIAAIAGIVTWKTDTGKWVLSKMASQVLGLFFGNLDTIFKVLKETVAKIGPEAVTAVEIEMTKFVGGVAATTAEIGTEEATEEIPYVGWALKVAAITGDIATLTATTVECLLSPATYKLEVLHTMDLNVKVSPDPAHGKPGVAPVWPLVADHYVIHVKYPKGNDQDGGTTYTKAGPMPGKYDNPIALIFDKIPAGGKIEVTASIYSDNNWLAGIWNSGWLNADPDKEDQLNISGNIKENLVPLVPETIYTQKQLLAYSEQDKHFWEVTLFSINDSFTATLDKGEVDSNLKKVFHENGNTLSGQTVVTVLTQGSAWTLTDKTSNIVYDIAKKEIYNGDNETLYELKIQNTTHAAPGIPEPIQDCGSGGHRVCQRMGITINDKEYQLGYAWQASGQNLPRDYGKAPDNGQMYTFQSISTLGSPEQSIVEPGRGFSNSAYIAFDQFGLTPLFDLDLNEYKAALNHGGNVPKGIVTELGKFSLVIPEGAQTTVITPDVAWDLGLLGQDPLFSLRTVSTVKKGKQVQVINTYSWPVPKLDNFYLDSRTYTPDSPLYYLRGINFVPGQSSFDYDSKKSWGCFQNVTIKALAVHPHGYIVGADYDNHKLLALRLPAEAVEDAAAPIAMPLAGEGVREGLLNKPVALTITADGRILMLEEGNQRVQAFDTKGNPVPCFSVGQPNFPLDAKFISTLDSHNVDTELIQEFQTNVRPELASLFSSSADSITALDDGKVDAALSNAFVLSWYVQKQEKAPEFSVVVTEKSKLWLVTDEASKAVYDVRVMASANSDPHLYVFHCFSLVVDVKSAGQEWMISDKTNAMTFEVNKDQKKNTLTVQRLVSVMPLRDEGTKKIQYMDIAVETKGYIYILSNCTEGQATEYRLDIYNPDGSTLLEAPQTGVNAAKLTVDQWRSLFTLNFEKFLGPGQRTEPGISEWMPSTPGKPASNI